MTGTTEKEFDRDYFARWYGGRHFETDSGVERIFYLPTNAPLREVRLLEVNNMVSEMTPIEPIDFGVDLRGAEGHTLFVLDVTPAQWEAIHRKELPLPSGWTLDGSEEILPNGNGR